MKNKRAVISTLLIGSILAAVIFFALITVEREMLKDYQTGNVVVAVKDCSAGTLLTEENLTEYFTLYPVTQSLITGQTFSDVNSLLGLFANRSISAGEIVYQAEFSASAAQEDELREPVELSISVEQPADIVAGRIRKGDKVSVFVYEENEKEERGYQCVLQNVTVHEAYDNKATVISMSNKTDIVTMFTVYVEKEAVKELINKLYSGQIKVIRETR